MILLAALVDCGDAPVRFLASNDGGVSAFTSEASW